jgi:hypothetical protein
VRPMCAAGGASRSRRDELSLCRPRDATACPSRLWRRVSRAAHVFAAGGASRSRRDEHTLCRPRDATALPSRLWRRACGSLVDRFYRHIVPDLDPPPPRGAALARRSLSRLARPHARACALHAACLSSDPDNSAPACSDCATCRRIPVILAPRPVTGHPPAERTGRAGPGPFRFPAERTVHD